MSITDQAKRAAKLAAAAVVTLLVGTAVVIEPAQTLHGAGHLLTGIGHAATKVGHWAANAIRSI